MREESARAQVPGGQEERRVNETPMSSSERRQETKGQFRIKNDLRKWLRTWVPVVLAGCTRGLTADGEEQLYGNGPETQLNSYFAPGSELLCGSSAGGPQS